MESVYERATAFDEPDKKDAPGAVYVLLGPRLTLALRTRGKGCYAKLVQRDPEKRNIYRC